METSTQQAKTYKGMAIAAWIMIGLICLGALIPGVGFLTWFIGIPILLITFILGIVIISKNGTGQGIFILLASLIFAPIFIAVAPVVTTGGVLLAGAAASDKSSTASSGYAETSSTADTGATEAETSEKPESAAVEEPGTSSPPVADESGSEG